MAMDLHKVCRGHSHEFWVFQLHALNHLDEHIGNGNEVCSVLVLWFGVVQLHRTSSTHSLLCSPDVSPAETVCCCLTLQFSPSLPHILPPPRTASLHAAVEAYGIDTARVSDVFNHSKLNLSKPLTGMHYSLSVCLFVGVIEGKGREKERKGSDQTQTQ